VVAQISDPRTDSEGLRTLQPLWVELFRHHREVSSYPFLVDDQECSWARRLSWYRRLLKLGACYLTADDEEGRLVGYTMVAFETGSDDTFEVSGGIAEIVTLVVTRSHRSAGVGRALLSAAERVARERGFDTITVKVMSGNARAEGFYEAHGYALAEQVLYRRLK